MCNFVNVFTFLLEIPCPKKSVRGILKEVNLAILTNFYTNVLAFSLSIDMTLCFRKG